MTQSLFEASMYTFVFMWTPALEKAVGNDAAIKLPYGWIFASFMVSLMLGSVIFRVAISRYSWTPEKLVMPMMAIATLAFFLASFVKVSPQRYSLRS